MNYSTALFCLLLSLLGVIRAQNPHAFNAADLLVLSSLGNDEDRPLETFRQFKKSFVRPCMYSMGNCITTTQQERLLKHMRSLVALREQEQM